ncbi:MAG: primosomal protein N' [Phycisphaerae bacterium]|nr:primosomal protein N' [Phycisphaerae bacterium]
MDERLPFAIDDAPGAVDPAVVSAEKLEGRLVRVVIERSIDDAGRGATAKADEGLTYVGEDLEVGARVEAPLGRGNALAAGYVVARGGAELLGGLEPRKLKSVARAAGPILPPELIELARWVSRYYVTPLGMVLGAIVPGAAKRGTGTKVEEVVTPSADAVDEPEGLTPTVAEAWRLLRALPGSAFPATRKTLAGAIERRTVREINVLIKHGLLEVAERSRVRVSGAGMADSRWVDHSPAPDATDAQLAVIEGVWPGAEPPPGFGVHLLRGVTGSGKTEVYLRLMERCLAAGRAALALVPEIALTPQTAGRFMGRFPDAGVVVLHSGMSASARHDAWDRARRGEARVVIGPRSAVFAPLRDLGLVVVDEEHEPSYKQDSLPRYHGRDVAIKRAQLAGAPIVLGSATPSMESWRNAVGERARYRLWRLNERVGGGRLPRVEVVDMLQQRRAAQDRNDTAYASLVGPTLFDALRSTLGAGGQAMLLLNRRGYASRLVCSQASCGWMLRCHHCDVAMVLHRAGVREGQNAPRGFFRCHQCRAEQRAPARCPTCESSVVRFGIGGQQAEEKLREMLATRFGLDDEHSIARVDSDAVASSTLMHDTLRRFAAGEIRVLLGTQMIAKGLDIPNVRLVGVLDADTSLAIPDFRAAERTFQLVSQVAGRAGRGEHAGRVVVQTMDANQPCIQLAATHDFEAFASAELRDRFETGFPPATRMARIVCRDTRHDRASEAAAALATELRSEANPDVWVDGPAPCPIARIADHFRFRVELTGPNAKSIQALLQSLRTKGMLKSDARTAVDVDPISLI